MALAATALLSACSGFSSQSAPTTAPATSSTAPAGGAAASPVVGQKVKANSASVSELQRGLETAGISNAGPWAGEVEEYRPYPTDDPSFAKLRRELAKYNPGPSVVDRIVATLTVWLRGAVAHMATPTDSATPLLRRACSGSGH